VQTLFKEILRWIVILATGGAGLWLLGDVVRRGVGTRFNGDWTDIFGLMMLILLVLAAAPFWATAYFCWHRQYRKLFLVLGIVGCVVLFLGLPMVFEELGLFKSVIMRQGIGENLGFGFLEFPIGLLITFAPICAAAGFYHWCHRLAYPLAPGVKRPKTRATRWLVWLGVLCLLLPMPIAMFGTFHARTQSEPAAAVAESIREQIHWVAGISLIGGCVMLLGLIRRKPIHEPEENAASLPAA
jgi:hypothetical protein